MKVSPVINNINLYRNNINFGVKMSDEVQEDFEFLKVETLGIYGKDSIEYSAYKNNLDNIKRYCPKEKLTIYTIKDNQGYNYYTFALKRFLKKTKILYFQELHKDSLFTLENMVALEAILKEEDKKRYPKK